MAAKKSTPKSLPATKLDDPNIFYATEGEQGVKMEMNRSQLMAQVAAPVLAAFSFKAYAGCGDDMGITDLTAEMEKASQEVVDGDLGRIERMLVRQSLTLDAIFNNMAQRAAKAEYLKTIEVYMRLAMKAQAQARSTAEALALLKNPQPYIRQANIAQGHQQVNNSFAGAPEPTLENRPSPALSEQYAQTPAGAGKSSFEQSKLLRDAQ
jgi:hypothetical protein